MLIFSRLSIFSQSLVAEPNFLFSPQDEQVQSSEEKPRGFVVLSAG